MASCPRPLKLMRTRALRTIVLVALTAQLATGTARLLCSDLSDTCGVCDLRVMRTAVRGGFLPYCLDGKAPLMADQLPRARTRELRPSNPLHPRFQKFDIDDRPAPRHVFCLRILQAPTPKVASSLAALIFVIPSATPHRCCVAGNLSLGFIRQHQHLRGRPLSACAAAGAGSAQQRWGP